MYLDPIFLKVGFKKSTIKNTLSISRSGYKPPNLLTSLPFPVKMAIVYILFAWGIPHEKHSDFDLNCF